MRFSLIVCTYMRPLALQQLLESVAEQTACPDQILIIDGSLDKKTESIVKDITLKNIEYHLVDAVSRGLTKQRNYGIKQLDSAAEIVCFLDDDTVLTSTYFFEILQTFQNNESYIGVGGVAINENNWMPKEQGVQYNKYRFYDWDGYIFLEGLRNVVRNVLGLASNLGPSRMPLFSHGRTCGFPLVDKTYEVDLLIGMSMAFRTKIFKEIQFSHYFEGYGLYEDADFSLRALRFGKNSINTKAQLFHNHEPLGRPNQYQYGKMVVRNGWHVWRTYNPQPSLRDTFKWHAITIVLLFIRFTNTFTTKQRKAAFTEALGRFVGWWSLLVIRPK
jgi:glycosyltransferase involved in cell wall biosynthesis